jgi:hypothetical protein
MPPQALGDLNWIYFYSTGSVPGSGQLDGMRKLDRALRVDLAWLRQQTLLQEQTSLTGGSTPIASPPPRRPLPRRRLAQRTANTTTPDDILAFLTASEASETRLKAEAEGPEREQALKAAGSGRPRAT